MQQRFEGGRISRCGEILRKYSSCMFNHDILMLLQVVERLFFQGLEMDNTLLHVEAIELLGGGGVGNVVFNSTVSLAGISTSIAKTSELKY